MRRPMFGRKRLCWAGWEVTVEKNGKSRSRYQRATMRSGTKMTFFEPKSQRLLFRAWLLILCPTRLACIGFSLALYPTHAEGLLKLMSVGAFLMLSLAGFGLWITIQKTASKKMTVPMVLTDILAIVMVLPILLARFNSPPLVHIPWL